jgi:hypothetical protein
MNHKLTRELESLEASTKAVQMLQSAFEGLQSVNNIGKEFFNLYLINQ